MRTQLIPFVIFLLTLSFTGTTQDHALAAFENLVDKTWLAEGKWGDGSKFKQEIFMEFSLNKLLVTAKSKGFTNKEQTSYGLRNEGIRRYNPETQEIEFWEFDVFGGLTKGIVFAEGKNLLYQYSYGDVVVTDMWEYIDDSRYAFRVGIYEDGQWKQTFLKTQFVCINEVENHSEK